MSGDQTRAWINDGSVEPLAQYLTGQLAEPVDFMSARCPVCGTESSVHIHLHRFYDDVGGAWIWCSDCLRYDHDRRRLPSWWVNNAEVDLDRVASVPVTLDEDSVVIDRHWNDLLTHIEHAD